MGRRPADATPSDASRKVAAEPMSRPQMQPSGLTRVLVRLRSFRRSRGWEAAHTPRNLAISVSLEAGELLEHFQWGDVSAEDVQADPQSYAAIAEEIADVIIYAVQLADVLGMDPHEIVDRKIEANSRRFPALDEAAA